jgi:hypothetical protein
MLELTHFDAAIRAMETFRLDGSLHLMQQIFLRFRKRKEFWAYGNATTVPRMKILSE